MRDWNKSLPSIPVKNIDIRGTSLVQSWSLIGSQLLFRTVLYVRGTPLSAQRAFEFRRSDCELRDILNAFVDTYADLAFTQDDESGVIWIHPREIAYRDILSSLIDVPYDQLGLPMFTGIIASLCATEPSIKPIQRGVLFRNTFDYAVDIKAGRYTVRELINACCLHNPAKTFYISWNPKRQLHSLQPVNLAYHIGPEPTIGALALWQQGIGPVGAGGPSDAEFRAALGSPVSVERTTARRFLEAEVRRIDLEALIREMPCGPAAVWASLAVIETIARDNQFTFKVGVEKIRESLSDVNQRELPSDMYLIAAMEIARLTGDTRYLNVMADRDFKPSDLAPIRSRVHAIVRLSQLVREKMGHLAHTVSGADPAFTRLSSLSRRVEFRSVDGEKVAVTEPSH